MLQKLFATGVAACSFVYADAQDSTKSGTFTLSGNADVYYRYNFSKPPIEPSSLSSKPPYHYYNSPTSFTHSHNSFELGMASLKAEYTKGKAGVVADLGFGTRAEEFAYNDENTRFAIKQLYVTYAPSSKLKFTFGSWATHVGYEVLDAYLNRNYSMSYMFSNGPFSHTGLKADISLGGANTLMLGVANPTDLRSASTMPKTFIGQFATGTKDGALKAYFNATAGKQDSITKVYQGDIVVTYAVSTKFSVGYNGTLQSVSFKEDGDPAKSWESSHKWWGSALYFNYDPKDWFGLTLRGEYFGDKDHVKFGNVFAPTLTANFKVDGNLTIMPEFRLDAAKDEKFYKSSGEMTKSTATFLLAATYHF